MDATRIGSLVEPVLADHGLELEAVEIQPAGKRSVVRIVVDGDGAEGRGPNLDDITDATKAVSAALDESVTADPSLTGQESYTLEVSSRGISRPLTEPRHWRRNTGRLVKVTLAVAEPTAESAEVTGRIVESDTETVTLDVAGETKIISLAEVGKALVQVEFNRKEG